MISYHDCRPGVRVAYIPDLRPSGAVIWKWSCIVSRIVPPTIYANALDSSKLRHQRNANVFEIHANIGFRCFKSKRSHFCNNFT